MNLSLPQTTKTARGGARELPMPQPRFIVCWVPTHTHTHTHLLPLEDGGELAEDLFGIDQQRQLSDDEADGGPGQELLALLLE